MRKSFLGLDSAVSALFVMSAFTVSLPQPAYADPVTPPSVPDKIKVEPGNTAFLVGHAVGTQNYICLPSGTGFKFVLFTPEATLFKDNDRQVTTHFFSPNPSKNNAIQATWLHSRDSSAVWGELVDSINHTSNPDVVAPDAVAWLLLKKAGVEEGPTGGDTLTATTFIQRLNTSGGLAPSTGCGSLGDVGTLAFVPYKADYFFYKKDPPN